MKRKTAYLISVAALALFVPPSAGATRLRLESPVLRASAGSLTGLTSLLASAPRRLSQATWWGGTYAVPDGEHVSIYISASYPQADDLARLWVDFFDHLPHGEEISLVKVYIAPLDEVSEMCLSDEVVGCYGDQTLVTVGDSSAGFLPASIAAHEYGHHVAANRSNAPWRAVDWGTKRWASAMGICGRVTAGTAVPGDEGASYTLNPGEGFAESYRVLAETGGAAAGFDWPIVDPSFRPTQESFAAIREDVFHPWAGPTTRTTRGKFLRGRRTWSTQVATLLDGDLRVRVTVPGGGADDVTLFSGDGRTVLATGSWASSGGKSAEYRVCGARSLRVRVTRGGAAARFTLQVQAP
jgi:hypothetical protein